MRIFISSLVLLLVVVGCSNVVPSTTSEVHDSTHVEVRYRDVPYPVPGEKVVVTEYIECDKATNKPVAQQIKAHSGKAIVDVIIKNDGSVTATGGCDSLVLLTRVQDSVIFHLRTDKSTELRVVQVHTPYWFDKAARVIAGITVLAGIGFIFFKLKKFLPI